jgi:hypothetical protein
VEVQWPAQVLEDLACNGGVLDEGDVYGEHCRSWGK